MSALESQLLRPQDVPSLRQWNDRLPAWGHQEVCAFGASNGGQPIASAPMGPAPQTMSDVIAGQIGTIPHVRMIQLGRSEAVYHVWTITDQWTPEARREIYSAQKKLLEWLRGFELDFYLVRLFPGESPGNKSAGFPVIFERT